MHGIDLALCHRFAWISSKNRVSAISSPKKNLAGLPPLHPALKKRARVPLRAEVLAFFSACFLKSPRISTTLSGTPDPLPRYIMSSWDPRAGAGCIEPRQCCIEPRQCCITVVRGVNELQAEFKKHSASSQFNTRPTLPAGGEGRCAVERVLLQLYSSCDLSSGGTRCCSVYVLSRVSSSASADKAGMVIRRYT